MSNNKKNPFWTNASLFSTSLLEDRIYRGSDLKDYSSVEIKEKWKELQQFWNNDDFQQIINSIGINESNTEDQLIFPVIKLLGFETLSKEAISIKGVGTLYPDYVLYDLKNDVARASNSKGDYKFKNALGIVEGKRFGRDLSLASKNFNPKLDDKKKQECPPIQLTNYLKETEIDWGILTNGAKWQLFYRRGSARAARYFEFNLKDILDHGKITKEFSLFIYLFSKDAFIKDSDGRCRLDKVYEDSSKYASDISGPFFLGCESALFKLFSEYQKKTKAISSKNKSEKCHQFSMIFLFRIIAIRYLEDKGLLPTLTDKYRKMSLDYLRMKIEEDFSQGHVYNKSSYNIHGILRVLFKAINKGTFGIYPNTHSGLESDLFDQDFDDFFSANPLSDNILAEILDWLFRGKGQNSKQIDFYDLGTEKLGDVYNCLLGTRLIEKNKKFQLINSLTDRKSLGSYYTSTSLSDILVDGIVDYYKKEGILEKWRTITFCDNSCGSGNFLRELINRLSYEVSIADFNQSLENPLRMEDVARYLAVHCAFGIDKDVNAVRLAKLSIYLQTAVWNKPFVFLDHHIIKGDAIISRKESIIEYLTIDRLKELQFLISKARQTNSENREEIKRSIDIHTKIKNICDSAFKKYCSDQIKIVPHLEKDKELFEKNARTNKNIYPRKEIEFFFNYCSSFPEIFQPNGEGGFDIIIGNPPWDVISPKKPDFYKYITGNNISLKGVNLENWMKEEKLEQNYLEYASFIYNYASTLRNCTKCEYQNGIVKTYSYFVEKSLQCLKENGIISYIVPIGLSSDKSTQDLRRFLFLENTMLKILFFRANRIDGKAFFPAIDPNEKFMIFLTQKTKLNDYILKAKQVDSWNDKNYAFNERHNYPIPSSLDNFNRIKVNNDPNIRSIYLKIDKNCKKISEVGLKVNRNELDVTKDAWRYSTTRNKISVYAGRNVFPHFTMMASLYLLDTSVLENYPSTNLDRIGVRKILPNSRRKLIASIIPANSIVLDSIMTVTNFTPLINLEFVLACLNAMITEVYLKPYLAKMALNNFRLQDLPLPMKASKWIQDEITKYSKGILKNERFKKCLNESNDSENRLSLSFSLIEDMAEYKKVEALLAVSYDLTDEEIRKYISSFKDGPGEVFINDVISYAKIYREKLDIIGMDTAADKLRKEVIGNGRIVSNISKKTIKK